jgi:hypothetical protein
MKTISFAQAYKALEDCSAVIWGDNFLTYPGLHDEESGTPETDLFLELCTVDDTGEEYKSMFYRGPNQQVQTEGCSMFLRDDNGEDVQVTILGPQVIAP